MYKDVLSLYQSVPAGAKFLSEEAPDVGNFVQSKEEIDYLSVV